MDVWVDEERRKAAAERQRKVQRECQRRRGLAAVVNHCESQGGGKAVATLTLFAGMGPSLYEESIRGEPITLCASHKTLRTYWRNHDNESGSILEVKTIANPAPGSSGVQLRGGLEELLKGFARHRIVRGDLSGSRGWPRVKLPPEERLR